MNPTLKQLIDYVKIYESLSKRNKKNVELKILAALLYFFGLSLRNKRFSISIRRNKP